MWSSTEYCNKEMSYSAGFLEEQEYNIVLHLSPWQGIIVNGYNNSGCLCTHGMKAWMRRKVKFLFPLSTNITKWVIKFLISISEEMLSFTIKVILLNFSDISNFLRNFCPYLIVGTKRFRSFCSFTSLDILRYDDSHAGEVIYCGIGLDGQIQLTLVEDFVSLVSLQFYKYFFLYLVCIFTLSGVQGQ